MGKRYIRTYQRASLNPGTQACVARPESGRDTTAARRVGRGDGEVSGDDDHLSDPASRSWLKRCKDGLHQGFGEVRINHSDCLMRGTSDDARDATVPPVLAWRHRFGLVVGCLCGGAENFVVV